MSQPVVLVTGALTGIGRATAFAFAEEGARIVVSGRREEEGKALAAEHDEAQKKSTGHEGTLFGRSADTAHGI